MRIKKLFNPEIVAFGLLALFFGTIFFSSRPELKSVTVNESRGVDKAPPFNDEGPGGKK